MCACVTSICIVSHTVCFPPGAGTNGSSTDTPTFHVLQPSFTTRLSDLHSYLHSMLPIKVYLASLDRAEPFPQKSLACKGRPATTKADHTPCGCGESSRNINERPDLFHTHSLTAATHTLPIWPRSCNAEKKTYLIAVPNDRNPCRLPVVQQAVGPSERKHDMSRPLLLPHDRRIFRFKILDDAHCTILHRTQGEEATRPLDQDPSDQAQRRDLRGGTARQRCL